MKNCLTALAVLVVLGCSSPPVYMSENDVEFQALLKNALITEKKCEDLQRLCTDLTDASNFNKMIRIGFELFDIEIFLGYVKSDLSNILGKIENRGYCLEVIRSAVKVCNVRLREIAKELNN